jgi:hypothetical protein
MQTCCLAAQEVEDSPGNIVTLCLRKLQKMYSNNNNKIKRTEVIYEKYEVNNITGHWSPLQEGE